MRSLRIAVSLYRGRVRYVDAWVWEGEVPPATQLLREFNALQDRKPDQFTPASYRFVFRPLGDSAPIQGQVQFYSAMRELQLPPGSQGPEMQPVKLRRPQTGIITIPGAFDSGDLSFPELDSAHPLRIRPKRRRKDPWSEPVCIYNPEGPLKVVILGDGFRETELKKFASKAQLVKKRLLSFEPYASFKKSWSIWRVDAASPQSGIDKPAAGIQRRTVFDTTFGSGAEVQRIIDAPNESRIHRAAEQKFDPLLILVLANTTELGGSGMPSAEIPAIAYSSLAPRFQTIVTHEMGHVLVALADEYECLTCAPGEKPRTYGATLGDPANANVTNSKTSGKWSVGHPPGANFFEGGLYAKFGIFRSQKHCHMRAKGSKFCVVCVKNLKARLAALISA